MEQLRIAGINIPLKKSAYIALTAIYGIGISRSKQILNSLEIHPERKIYELKNNELKILQEIIETSNLKIENELKKYNQEKIGTLIDIKCYKGIRHFRSLPVRGQRTRTNARTMKRQKKTYIKKDKKFEKQKSI
jgi:small subunit ribosomal protein S13